MPSTASDEDFSIAHPVLGQLAKTLGIGGRKEAGMVFVACETCVSSRVAARGLQIWLNHNQIIKTYQTLNDSPLVNQHSYGKPTIFNG